MAEDQHQGSDAASEAHDADKTAIEAREKEANAGKTPEQIEAEKAEEDARRKHSEAAEAEGKDADEGPTKAVDAKVLGVTDGELLASDPRAQKMGNDPANPKHAPHLPETEDTVRLTLRSPDTTEPRTADVHPGMVGDYLRAGWER